MNTETLIKFFNSKLEKIPELRHLNDNQNPTFKTWWNTVTSTCERMGEPYKKRANKVHFYPGMTIMGADNSVAYAEAYQSGLNDAESLIKSVIEELEMWGYGKGDREQDEGVSPDNQVVLNLTISQQQAQQITQTINLAQYDPEIQEKIQELLSELRKESKDKPKIIGIVKWLADKGADALIAILLAAAQLA